MPKYRKTLTTQGVKFVIESEKSNEFVDHWINFLKNAPEPLVESQDTQPNSITMSTPPDGCGVLPTKGGQKQ